MVSLLQTDDLGLTLVVVVYFDTASRVQRLGLLKTFGSEDSQSIS